jgi:DEAD/DEAH box helicase domain-containing protein
MRKIVFDIETKGAAGPNFLDMEISLLAIHDSNTDEYSSYMEEDFPKLWPILEDADMLIGFNSDHFDIPILNKYYPGDLTKIKSLDILKEVKNACGRRFKLDNIAEHTLGQKKGGHGLQAVKWWEEGKIDLIREYCIQDVKVTKGVYDFAMRHGKLKYKDLGGVREIELDTSDWEKIDEDESEGMTHTLPF